jgi:bifunctional non-homologous end joining protein LigD
MNPQTKDTKMNATINPPKAESVTLYYREGASDKVYQCSIVPNGNDLFDVNFAYGRRGTTLQTGMKTSSPVKYDDAKRIFDKLVREKTAKGYTPGEDGTPYRQTGNEGRATAILPQLLNTIEEEEVARLIKDQGWCLQEKKDGRRLLLQSQGAAIHGINKKGLLIGLPSPIVGQAAKLGAEFIVDGESVGDVLYAFDLLQVGGDSLVTQPYRERLALLIDLLDVPALSHIEVVTTAFTSSEKAKLFDRLKRDKKEGVVLKRLDAPYTPGRPNSGGPQLKYKFVATLSAVVAKINAQRSVELRLLNGDGWKTAGNVTIPSNHAVPKVGAVVEIRYLYALPGSGCLYQPVFLGLRQDVEAHECVVSQLKFKGEDDEDRP